MGPILAFCQTYDLHGVCDYEVVRRALDHSFWEITVYGFSAFFLFIIFFVMVDAMIRQPRPPLDRALVYFFGIFCIALTNRLGIEVGWWDNHLFLRIVILGIAVITEANVLHALHYERRRNKRKVFHVKRNT